ncbi:MAG: response regulator transcription factor [Anaerolineales bacterium]
MLTRVLLADGCAFTRDGLQVFLEQHQIEISGQVYEWEELVHQIEKYSPQVIVLGSNLQGLSGPADFTAKQNHLNVQPHWLIFGEQDTLEAAHIWLESGADGSAWRGDAPELLLTAIQVVRQGQRWLSPHLKEAAGPDLSSNERQLLNWLAQGKTNKWIACQQGVSLRAVKYHLTDLYAKLGVRSRAEAVVWAVRKGINQ